MWVFWRLLAAFYFELEVILSFAIVAWFILSVILLGFWGWTVYVVIKQKNAWKLYADKRKMRFHSNGILETPSISGSVDGYRVTIFPSEHSELDARSQRRLTAIEISLHTSIPIQSAIASGGMVPVIEKLHFKYEYRPPAKKWEDSYVIRTADRDLTEAYLTDDRVTRLIELMKVDKAWIIFLALNDTCLLRLDTPLPLDNPKKLDSTIKQLVAAAQALDLEDGEEKDLLRKQSKTDKERSVLSVDEKLLDDDVGFELEDE